MTQVFPNDERRAREEPSQNTIIKPSPQSRRGRIRRKIALAFHTPPNMILALPWFAISFVSLACTWRKGVPPATAANDDNDDNKNGVVASCWDDCFDTAALATILAAGETRAHGFPYIFDRQGAPWSDPPPLGSAIASLLEQIELQQQQQPQHDDGTLSSSVSLQRKQHRYVEYWWRDVVQMLPAHRDIDEDYGRRHQIPVALGSDEKFAVQRCPTAGHVLYVSVVASQAPTVVWQEKGDFASGAPRELDKLVVVPAVSNRLLRFRGDCLHAVCHPAWAFLDTATPALADKDPDHMKQNGRRAVLLFNTWEEPPLHPPVGESLASDNDDALKRKYQRFSRQPCVAKPYQQWNPHAMTHLPRHNSTSTTMTRRRVKLSVPLLGSTSRRGCHQECLDSFVDEHAAIQALTSNHAVHCLKLYSSETRQ